MIWETPNVVGSITTWCLWTIFSFVALQLFWGIKIKIKI
jgi:hypothetical protein